MPRSKNKIRRPNPDNDSVIAAAKRVLENSLSVRAAAKEYKISKTTLARHLKKHREEGREEFVYAPSNAVKQVFTTNQEEELNGYIKQCANMHYGLSTDEVRKLAFTYAKSNKIPYPEPWNINQKAGIDWLKYFLKRNKDISLRKPQATSLARSTAFNKTNVNLFFDKLEEVMERYNFGPEDIYNLDESGMSTVHVPVRIIATKGLKQVGSMTSGERGLNITIISSINAVGNSIPPLFVFPRVHFKEHMLKGAPAGSVGMANPSGWSNSSIFLEYLRHLVKYTRSSDEHKILLILDNHDSHISVDVLNFAKANGIVMLTLPPHTSHKLHTLDRTVFGPLKKYYNVACSEWLLTNSGKPMTLYDVAECVGKAYPKAFSADNIVSGFKVSGIFPLNRNIFGEHEFLSSFVTDRPEQTTNIDNTLSTDSTSSSSQVQEDESQTDADQPVSSTALVVKHITPELVRPFPKAQPRKGNKRGGRKLGRCRILTDTPEKNELEEEAAAKKRKITCKKSKIKKVVLSSSSSSESEAESWSSGDSLDDVEWNNQEDDDEMATEEINVGGFVLIKFQGKKSQRFFIAKVVEVINDDMVGVTYLKKIVGGKFVSRDETVYELQKSDVVMSLPSPTVTGGTERRSNQMQFSIDLSGYNVE